MRTALKLLIGSAAVALSLPTAASAAPIINFDFTGGARSFSFQLEQGQAPTRSNAFAGATQVTYQAVPGSFTGVNGSSSTANVTFGTSFYAPIAISAPGFGFGSFGGNFDLFDGSRTSPTFRTGTFNLFQAPTGAGTGGGLLTISAAGVPEPATWAFLLLGFGLVGGAMRRRTRVRFAAA